MLGLYLQQAWNPVPWLALNGGVRMDLGEHHDSALSPRIAGVVDTWTGGTLKLIFSQAFRAPTWNEFAAQSNTLLLPQNLRPERATSLESVIEQKLGAQRLLFGAFLSNWSNLIELHTLSNEEYMQVADAGQGTGLTNFTYSQYRNIATIDAHGGNVGWRARSLPTDCATD